MRALQADRIAARQRARDSAARARRTAEEREAQLQTRRDAYARRTAGEREAELQMRRDADASRTPEVREAQNQTFTNNSIISIIIYINSMQIII